MRSRPRQQTGYSKFKFTEEEENEMRFADDDSGKESSTSLRKQHSSIDESKTVEIEDKDTDPNWHDEQRRTSREFRVRKRM